MAWTKAKTVVVASAAVLLTTGTTVVVVQRVISPAVDESFWDYKKFRKGPLVLIIRPTRYSDTGMVSSYGGRDEGQAIMHDTDLAGLLTHAYSSRQFWMIMPTNVPQGRFDLMLTLPDHPKEALQKAIQRKFGFTARRETREADVLVLEVKDPRLLALHASKPGSKMDFKHDFKQGKIVWAYANFPIATEAQTLEGIFFKPVLVQPGLSGNYDLTFEWDNAEGTEAQMGREQAFSDQLAQAGLELVPSREPIEMVVGEGAKTGRGS